MERSEIAEKMMTELNKRNVSLCIDDFGTGYSSLSYLHRLPVESLKIDQSFVSRIVDSDQGVALIKAILAMSQSLEIQVVAEGIETPEQVSKLQDLGCRYGQGYFFAKPTTAESMDDWLGQFVPTEEKQVL
jgi:EAL domain-containing protein (putative c-di-GMP-specific phosphodiesterase class I)